MIRALGILSVLLLISGVGISRPHRRVPQQIVFIPFCGGTNDTAAFSQILTAVGSNTATIRLPYQGTSRCAVNNVTIPANVTLDNTDGSGIFVNTGQTLTTGPINAPNRQIFYNVGPSLGTVIITGKSVLPAWFGTKGNGVVRTDCTTISGSATLTCTNTAAFGSFTLLNVGNVLVVNNAGPLLSGSYHGPLSTTITGFISSTQVTMGTTAGATVSSTHTAYGADDTTAIQNTVNALTSTNPAAGGGVVDFPAGVYMLHQVNLPCGATVNPFGFVNDTCTRAYNNIHLRGAGRDLTTFENWDVNFTSLNDRGSEAVITLGTNSCDPLVCTGTPGSNWLLYPKISGMTIRQVESGNTGRSFAIFGFATLNLEIFECRIISPSYEGIQLAGNSGHAVWQTHIHDNLLGPCGRGGPSDSFSSSASCLNVGGPDLLVDHNWETDSGQGIEGGGARARVIDNIFDAGLGTTLLNGNSNGSCIGIQDRNGGYDNYEDLYANNLFKSWGSGVAISNSNTPLDRQWIRNNTFQDVQGIVLSGGSDVLGTGGFTDPRETDTLFHAVSEFTNNTIAYTNPAQIGVNSVIQVGGPESWVLNNTNITYCPTCFNDGAGPVGPQRVLDFSQSTSKWQPNTSYTTAVAATGTPASKVLPTFTVPLAAETYTGNSFWFICTTAGTSGATEPTWPTSINYPAPTTVTDGTVVWTVIGLAPTITVNNFSINTGRNARMGNPFSSLFFETGFDASYLNLSNLNIPYFWSLDGSSGSGSALNISWNPNECVPPQFPFSQTNQFELTTNCQSRSGNGIPTAGFWLNGTKIQKRTVASGTGTGWIVTTQGRVAPVWSAKTYVFNEFVEPTVANQNGHVFEISVAGNAASGTGVEPTWCSTANCTVTLNGVTYKEIGAQAVFTDTAQTFTAIQTLTVNSATPSVASSNYWKTNNNALTTITNFTGGNDGQIIYVMVKDANTTIANNANIITGAGGSLATINGQMYSFQFDGAATVWRPLAPSVPVPPQTGGTGINSFNSTGLPWVNAGTWTVNTSQIVTVGQINATSSYQLGAQNTMFNTAPTISSGFGTSPSIVSSTGSFIFTVNVGGGGAATSGVISFGGGNPAPNRWVVSCTDISTNSATVFVTKQTAGNTTTATIGNFNTSAAAAAWAANDILLCIAGPN